jgi:hypothetical protein
VVKVKLSLYLNKAPRIGEWRYSSKHYLTSALDGGEWSASRSGRFTPRERDPGTHWIGGWVGSRAVLEAVVKRKIPNPHRESNLRTPIVQPVAQSYTNWAKRLSMCQGLVDGVCCILLWKGRDGYSHGPKKMAHLYQFLKAAACSGASPYFKFTCRCDVWFVCSLELLLCIHYSF